MAHAFVGRTGERRQLADLLDEAAGKSPVTVLIDGDAGVGKSSLVDWFVGIAVRKATVLRGACIELAGGATIPYGALTEALRLFARTQGTQAQRLAGRSWSTLGALISDDPRATLPAGTPDARPRIFGAMLRLPDYLGPRAPLVLVFEDLHWADSSTLDLIRYLTTAKTDQRLMLLCTFRSVATIRRHPLQSLLGEPDFSRRIRTISLPAFTRTELHDFVGELTGGTIPDDRLQRYFELSEGNAYFAEQIVTTDDLRTSHVEVPGSLRALMTARVNQLSEKAVGVVRIAAVAGRRLNDDLLAAVSDLDDRALEDALGECIRQRILVRDGSEDAYAFEHAILRETVYRAILPRLRKRLHAGIAAALPSQPGAATRLVPEVAYHWYEAGRWPEAFGAAVRAAATAVRMHAFPEAEAQYARVLDLWPQIKAAPARAAASREQILGRAADAARWAGYVDRALDWVRQAITEVDASADPGRAGELHERLGSYLWEAGRRSESAAAYAVADQLLAGRPPTSFASRVQSAMATAAMQSGDYATGLDRARRAAELAAAVGARAEEGRALNSIGLALALQGQAGEGERALRTGLAIAAEVDNLEDLFRAYGNLGVCLEHAGRLSDAVEAMTEGLARAKENGLLQTRQSGVLANNAAAALSSLGRYQEAAALLDSARLDRPLAESLYARLTRAEIHVAQGDFDAARRLLDEVGQPPNADPRFLGPLYGCRAELAVWRGDLDEARDSVERGLAAVASATDARVLVQLGAIGLRVAADLRGTPGRPADDVAAWADEVAATVRRAATDVADQNEVSLLTRLCYAERARVDGDDTPQMWAEIADGWVALERPFRAAYALGRLVRVAARAGDRVRATGAAYDGRAIAESLGAEPMRRYVEAAAQAHHLRLGARPPRDLSPAELDVLRELATGRTNRQIAVALHKSAKTVGAQIASVYAKLGVHTRTEAVGKAQRDGLLTDEPGSGPPDD